MLISHCCFSYKKIRQLPPKHLLRHQHDKNPNVIVAILNVVSGKITEHIYPASPGHCSVHT
jgi:hypothetical protein